LTQCPSAELVFGDTRIEHMGADVIGRRLDFQVLDPVVLLVTVFVMNVRALRDDDTCIMERLAMFKHLAVRVSQGVARFKDAYVAVLANSALLSVAATLSASLVLPALLSSASAEVIDGHTSL
jgi:hypothetical protein